MAKLPKTLGHTHHLRVRHGAVPEPEQHQIIRQEGDVCRPLGAIVEQVQELFAEVTSVELEPQVTSIEQALLDVDVQLGDLVKGGSIYGSMPVLALDGPDDVGDGRWIPSTAVDEYAATLARWYGVSAGDMPTVLPNLGRFQHTDLGFMA